MEEQDVAGEDLKRHEQRLVTIPPLSREQPPILGVPRESAAGSSTGASDLLYHSIHRRISDRMGGEMPRESYRWWLASGRGSAQQPPRAASSDVGPTALNTGQTCASEEHCGSVDI